MSVLSGVLGLGRGLAAARFTETFNVFYVTRVLDVDTGLMTDTEITIYASVLGMVKFPSLNVTEREQGAQVPAVQDVTIKVAVGSTPNVIVNYVWRCTGSLVDDSLIGREFRTKGLPQAGQTTQWRYPVEQVA